MKLGLRASAFAVLLVLAHSRGQAETLIRLDLPDDYSKLAVREMKAELGRIVKDADLGLTWARRDGAMRTVDGRIVTVSLSGECSGRTPLAGHEGPLGWTKSVDSRVVPYVELSCGRIGALLAAAWRNETQLERELYFGRALGRVLAHELAHALTRTRHHSGEVLRKRALSPRDLLTGAYRMAASDFSRPTTRVRVADDRSPERAEQPITLLEDAGR